MPSSGHRYIVRTVSEELDWRPVEFVDPPPPSRVCSVCGIVVRRTGLLLCGHRLCGPCDLRLYELGGPLRCPLDGLPCPEQQVRWRTFPAKDLERAVYCWNKDNGCRAILALSELSEHFLTCRHHMVACPKCSTKTLYNSLAVHLRSCTGPQGMGATGGVQAAGDGWPTSELTALKTTLSTATQQVDRQLGDLKALLEQLRLESSLQGDQLNALSHIVNDLKETLHRDLEANASRNGNSVVVAHSASEVGAVGGAGGEGFQKIDLLLRHVLKSQASHQWTLKGYGSLKGRARREGAVDRFSDPVYLCHYHLQLGVSIERSNHGVLLLIALRLKKGEVDDFVQWPFSRTVVLSVVHPGTGEKRTIEGVPDGRTHFYSRPTTASNETAFFNTCLYLDYLERDGFVRNDQLDLRFALIT